METLTFNVSNVKCGGCADIIKKGIGDMDGIDSVDVTIADGLVTIKGSKMDSSTLQHKLDELGYPVKQPA